MVSTINGLRSITPHCMLATALVVSLSQSVVRAEIPITDPIKAGFDNERLAAIDDLVGSAIADGKMPGCVVCFGRSGQIGYLRAFGDRQLDPAVPMTTDTLFDMASITKPVATATSIMILLEQGKLRLGDRVTKFFPEFEPNGKNEITVQDLLIHQSGLIPDNALADYLDGPETAWKRICELDLVAPVGTTFKYSDVNFIVLAKLVEKLSGKSVHSFSQQHLFRPLGMNETGYLPKKRLRARAAPTEKREGEWMRGEVHDPRAFALGGVAGHAGLFSTAEDLAIYANMMLGRGALKHPGEEVRILSPLTANLMTRAYPVSSGQRGLGWDKRTGYSSNKGDLLTDAAFGHGGFTGTVLWIDPDLDLFFIFLSNRVHPDGSGSVNHLAGQILNVVASSLNRSADHSKSLTDAHAAPVLTGIDVLVRDDFRQLSGQRVGLITNHTGRSADGLGTAELFDAAPGVQLSALFSPEHGFAGTLDVAEIDDAQDAGTGLTIYSLYGKTRKPTAEMLQGVDTVVFDIQDIGCRFYTYISTMGEAMEAAAEHGKRFVVLDRPNPIGGVAVAGPMLDKGLESFVGFHNLPVRHAMTTGELAKMFREENNLQLELDVIQCEGWTREQFYDQTLLTWINPSPNMRCLTQALLYPGIGLLETTNLSVGRGTDTPFEIFGAPWIEARELAAQLNGRSLPGVTFVPLQFTPESSKFAGQECGGVNVIITDREAFEPLSVGLEIAQTLRKVYSDQWEIDGYLRLLGNQEVLHKIRDGAERAEVWQAACDGIEAFKRRRSEFLMY